jgi:mRNA interferase RelE/StbE
MSQYTIQLTKKAEKQLDKLPNEIADLLLKAISTLKDNPKPQGAKRT